ncbi:hypothetical protein ACOME3_010368 [Neoechinorhynchus agilis]
MDTDEDMSGPFIPEDDASLQYADSSYTSTSIVSDLSPEIDNEDRVAFEKFGCKLLFFLKSLLRGKLIPRPVVKTPVHVQDKLTTSPCSFQSVEVKFFMNKISQQDDYTYPKCNKCQKWGHWAQTPLAIGIVLYAAVLSYVAP